MESRFKVSDILKILTPEQSNKLEADVDALNETVQALRNLSSKEVSHAHSVLETHKIMKKYWGYSGGVAVIHKLMPGID